MSYYNYFDLTHYLNCIKKYDKLHNSDTEILRNSLTIKKLDDIYKNDKYHNIIDSINNNLASIKPDKFIPSISERYRLDNIKADLNDLYSIIIPYIEKNIYNCYLKIIDIKILKHNQSKNIRNEGAFIWHYDNHPKTVINIIIYLNDVGDNCGGFEYITKNNTIVKENFKMPPGNRSRKNYVESNKNNLSINQMLGPKGTIFVFDNNIIHRAGNPFVKDRTAILIQLFPSLSKNF